jgi:hypothetical protein
MQNTIYAVNALTDSFLQCLAVVFVYTAAAVACGFMFILSTVQLW